MLLDIKINFNDQEVSDFLKSLGYDIINYKIVEYERLYGPVYSNIEKSVKLAIKNGEDVSKLPSYKIAKYEIEEVFKNIISDKLKNILLND